MLCCQLILPETFQENFTMSLVHEKVLKWCPKSTLSYHFTETQVEDNISATQHRLQYNIGAAMQHNATQHRWYSTILVTNTISNDYLGTPTYMLCQPA